jgi:hypothetical protein
VTPGAGKVGRFDREHLVPVTEPLQVHLQDRIYGRLEKTALRSGYFLVGGLLERIGEVVDQVGEVT